MVEKCVRLSTQLTTLCDSKPAFLQTLIKDLGLSSPDDAGSERYWGRVRRYLSILKVCYRIATKSQSQNEVTVSLVPKYVVIRFLCLFYFSDGLFPD